MRLVLDASAAIEIVLDHNRARELAHSLEEAEEVMAPDLLVPEVVNSIWKYHRFEGLSPEECHLALERAFGLVDTLVPCQELYREAFLLARTVRRPAYDMFYVALALREDAGFLTMDGALRKEAGRLGVQPP